MLNETLSRREEEVMNAVYTLSGGRDRFLATPDEVRALLPPKFSDESALERCLSALELDGYFTLVSSERKGEKTYVVHMSAKGSSFRRESARRRRALVMRIAATVALAVLSALLGVVLKKLFA